MSQTQTKPDPAAKTEKPKGPIRRFFGTWIGSFVLAILILTPIRSSVVDWYDVPSGSMEPTILPGDRICANKLAYGLRIPLTFTWIAHWNHPKPGEIIIVHSPEEGGVRLVKRVIGKPGDTIEMKDNQLAINGKPLDIRPLSPAEKDQIEKTLLGDFTMETVNGREHVKMVIPTKPSPKRSFAPVVVPEGKYWVMGDNRDQSKDSRWWGFVDENKVTGRSSVIAFSLTDYYVPRASRFFKAIR
jgi:signal peptidase I